MINCILVGIGGFIGSVCRYLIGLIPLKQNTLFPVKTLVINVVGAFLIGMIAAAASKNKSVDPGMILMLKVGVCGGFTTFSTLAFETAALFKEDHMMMGILYVAASVVFGVLAVYFAQELIK